MIVSQDADRADRDYFGLKLSEGKTQLWCMGRRRSIVIIRGLALLRNMGDGLGRGF